jgi:hypothetical protein
MVVMRAEAEAAAQVRARRTPRRNEPHRVNESAEEGAEGASPTGAGTESNSTDSAAGSSLAAARDQLIALIPSEAVALFILLLGLTADASLGVRVGAVVLVGVLSIAWTVLSYFEARGGRLGAGWPGFEIIVGTVAFLAWTTSVPASPFTDLDLPTWAGPAIVTVVSAVLVGVVRARAIWAKPASASSPRQGAEPAPAA